MFFRTYCILYFKYLMYKKEEKRLLYLIISYIFVTLIINYHGKQKSLTIT